MTHPTIDVAAIRALALILDETGLTEIEVAEKDMRIRVARAPAQIHAFAGAPGGSAPIAPAVVAPLPEATDPAKHPGAVKSPMVGVAYLSADPSSPPFVTPGQPVAAGQTLLLIEAMKTFNQIKSPRAGVLGRILIENGAPVEYGEVLMLIES